MKDNPITIEHLQGDEVTGCADDQTFKSVSTEKLSAMARAMGRRGGMARVKKGLGGKDVTPERRREISMQGVEARRKKRAEANAEASRT